MTECSFGVAADRVVELITDIEPFEPNWENLNSLDLNSKRVESLIRLKQFVPNLDELNLDDNQVGYLTGIPSSVRTLSICNNKLSSLSSFGHLTNLERLDLSGNPIDSVHHLSCLKHLRDFKADGCGLVSLQGLTELDSLVKISLKRNNLTEVNFYQTKWKFVETLKLSRNKISQLEGIETLQNLTLLNLGKRIHWMGLSEADERVADHKRFSLVSRSQRLD